MRLANHASKSTVLAMLGLSTLTVPLVAQAQTVGHLSEEAGAKLSDADLAKDLQNPVADMISVPLESRLDVGPGSTTRFTMNLQPVVPFKLTEDWSVISRTIVPFIYQQAPAGDPNLDNPGESPVGKGPKLGGMGDITQSFFFAPKEPTYGWIWGAGPVFRLPSASRSAFGDGMWGAGPTAVALRQDGPWTYGMLANHIWSFAGWGPENVNTTYLQPFLAYTTASLTTFGVGTESGYSWTQNQWTVPLDVSVSQLVQIGKLPVELGLGARFYAERPAGGPTWGLKASITFVFPK